MIGRDLPEKLGVAINYNHEKQNLNYLSSCIIDM